MSGVVISDSVLWLEKAQARFNLSVQMRLVTVVGEPGSAMANPFGAGRHSVHHPQWPLNLNAPMVAEATIKQGLRLREYQEPTMNRIHLLVFEVVLSDVPEDHIMEDGGLDITGSDTVGLSCLDFHHKSIRVKHMAYANPYPGYRATGNQAIVARILQFLT